MTKIKYRATDGQEVELDVQDSIADITVEFARQDRSARRKARRHNNASVEAMREETGWEPPDKTVDIEADYIVREERTALATAIDCLSPHQQQLIQLRYFEEKTDAEIAKVFGVSRSAITQQFGTIHKALKKYLENI